MLTKVISDPLAEGTNTNP